MGEIFQLLLQQMLQTPAQVGRATQQGAQEFDLGQFLRDIAFLPGLEGQVQTGSDTPAAMATARERGVAPSQMSTSTRGRMLNPEARQGLMDLAQLIESFTAFSPGSRPGAMDLQDQQADATRVAHETFVTRLIEDSLLQDLVKQGAPTQQ